MHRPAVQHRRTRLELRPCLSHGCGGVVVVKDTPSTTWPLPAWRDTDAQVVADALDRYLQKWSTIPYDAANEDEDRWEIVPALGAAINELRRLHDRWMEIGGLSPGDDPPDDRREIDVDQGFALGASYEFKRFERRWLDAKYPPEDDRAMMPPLLAWAYGEMHRLRKRVLIREAELHDDPSLA